MIKERAWPVRAMYMLIAAALAISLIITAAPALRVSADPGLSEWDRVPTPSQDGFVLAPDTIIIDYAIADDGEVAFAIVANMTTSKYLLLKSTDHAATWEDIIDALEDEVEDDGYTLDALLKVATDNVDPDFVAVALVASGNVHVYISSDGGATFRDTDEVEDGGRSFPTPASVADLAVSPEDDDERDIAIVGQDDQGDAVIFRCSVVGEFSTGWEDARYDGWDDDPDFATSPDPVSLWVTWVEFAPSWDADRTILVTTVADGTSTDEAVYLQSGTWGTTEGWNAESNVAIDAVLIEDNIDLPMQFAAYDARALAGLTTPLDYSGRNSGSRQLWVWVNYYVGSDTAGTIFRVKNESVNPIGWQVEDEDVWLTNVDYLGYISEGKAIAGVGGDGEDNLAPCCEGVQVYRNDNIVGMDICCYDWEAACKPPTGRAAMAVSYVSDDPATSKAYAVALWCEFGYEAYDESAWSVSFDDGDVWNQLSLVDTHIDYLSDVAVSPDCNKTMLVSVNTYNMTAECECTPDCTGCDSVWLHAENLPEADEYSGKWLRTWCGQLVGYNNIYFPEAGLLRLAPEETTGETVYLVDRMGDTVYWNEMETLACWDQGSATVDNIVDLAVKDKETIYALDAGGTVAMSDDYALGWHPEEDSLVTDGCTIAVRGDDILVGGLASDVSYSADGGETFTELEDVALVDGAVTVAFDSYFDANDTIYAALAWAGTDNGVYRWVIDESDAWYDLRAEPSTFQLTGSGLTTDTNEVNYTGLVLDRPSPGNPMSGPDTGGVLYASYIYMGVSGTLTGVARHLTPAEDIVCRECGEWDYLIVGFTPGELLAMMPALKICGCLSADSNSKLFAIDGSAPYDMVDAETGTVWSFEDCFAKDAPELASPADGATIASDPCTCFNVPFTLMWDRQCNACEYDVQFALDENFIELVDADTDYLPSAGDKPTYHVAGGIFTCEFTYYWRVRSSKAETGQIIHSWWSEPRSFTIAPAAGAGVKLVAPKDGATDVAVTDVSFSWSAVGSADKYDWKLSRNADLSAPIATKTGLTTTATAYTGTALAYDTPYYWQVSALKEGAVISTSTIGTFRTMPEPPPPPDDAVVETPVWVWVVIAIGAVLVIVVIVLIFRTRRV